MVAADARTLVTFSLSPGQAHDAPEGQKAFLIMHRAYEGNETHQLGLALGFTPVVPPLNTRIEPWEYDRYIYKMWNEVERLFRRLKEFRRISSRFEKLDTPYIEFILFALITDALR